MQLSVGGDDIQPIPGRTERRQCSGALKCHLTPHVLVSRDRTNEVKILVGFGQADLWLGDGRIKGTGWPKAINWKGSGDARIDIDVVGSGDVSVRLE